MIWKERVKQEVLAVLAEHDVFSTMEQVARDIAEAMPSPDERNGYVIVPIEPTEGMLEELARIGDGPMISGKEVWGYMLAAASAVPTVKR